jgi:hypothetical protein
MQGMRAEDTMFAQKLFRGLAIAIGGGLLAIGRGMQLNPHEVDQQVGLVVYLAATVIVFSTIFQWKRTALTPPNSASYRVALAIVFILYGCVFLTALFVASSYGGLSGVIARPMLGFALGFCLVLVGAGLLSNAQWARAGARIVAFPLSLAFPFGLLVALCAWWVIGRSRARDRLPIVRADLL